MKRYFLIVLLTIVAISFSYTVKIGDTISLMVYQHQELSLTQMVAPDGTISIPFYGEIEAEGKDLTTLKDEIQSKISKYIPNALVSLYVSQYAPNRVFIFMNGNNEIVNFYSRLSILQLISQLNISTQTQDLQNAILIRNNVRKDINIQSIINGKSKDFYLQDKDTLIINKSDLNTYIKILGAVNSPQSIPPRDNLKLSLILSLAGGLKPDADSKNAVIIKDNKIFKVNLDDILTGKASDISITKSTTIFVPTLKQQYVYVSGEVNSPKAIQIPKDTVITLLKAITIAGGMNKNASQYVELKRNDKISVYNFVNIKNGTEKDIALEPSDIIIVKPSKRYVNVLNGNISGKIYFSADESMDLRTLLSKIGGYDKDVSQLAIIRGDKTSFINLYLNKIPQNVSLSSNDTLVLIRNFDKKYYIFGNVANPGSYPLYDKISIIKAISQADPNSIMSKPSVKLVTKDSSITLTFDKWYNGNVYVKPGDIIYVEHTLDKVVYVFGKVAKPGIVEWREGLTLLEALYANGDYPTKRAADVVLVFNHGINNKPLKFDLKKLLKGEEKDIQLQYNNVVYVPETIVPDLNALSSTISNMINIINGSIQLYNTVK